MKLRMNWFKRVLAAGLSLSMLFGMQGGEIPGMEDSYVNIVQASEVTDNSQGNAGNTAKDIVKNGSILQVFCWSFNTIKDNMADIAAAGYTAIQTSPINECEDSYPEMTLMGNKGKWYYHYQPTDWKIGNYQLGTRDEFRAMCDEADKYGIKVIVDILPNHTSVVLENVSEDLVNAVGGNQDDLYHDTGFTDMSSYSDRLQCTYYSTGGLPDVDTENAGFQAYFFEYLKDCIACGADGFRIDTAKHIALPDDPAPEGTVNNFYPELSSQVVSQNDLFVYGEVLQGANERLGAYQEAIGGTTASSYGASIRTALVSNDYSVAKIQDYQIEEDADPSKLVTWVESHDNYLNDGTWSMLDETQIKLGWAIVGARKEGTPLFFSRPRGSSLTNQYGDNTIGIAGSDIYKDDEVAAVNKFRVAMTGESENLRNPDGNSQILMVERGDKGVVIVNGSYSSVALDSATNLADGTYVNMTDDNSIFTVSNGVINGTLPARSVVVLYEKEATEQTTVLFYNSGAWTNVWAKVNDSEEMISAVSDGDGWWRVTVTASVAEGFSIVFTDGQNTSETFHINASSGRYVTGQDGTCYTSKSDAEEVLAIEKLSVYFFNSSCWDSVSAYAWGTSEVLGGWPGVPAVYEGNYWWRVDVPAEASDGLNIIFNDNNNGNQTESFVINNTADVYTTGATTEKYASKEAAETAIGISSNSTTVYFYNSSAWENVYAYSYGNSEALGGWPGQATEDVGDGWWKVTIPEGAGMDLHVIFNNNNGSQSSDFTISNIRDIYTTGKNGTKYASRAAAEEALGLSSTEVTLYYYDTHEWDTTYAYAKNASTGEEYLGEWPGCAMEEDWNGWQTITVPTSVSEDLQVTFSNGVQEGASTFTVNDRTKVYLTGADLTAYTGKIAAETALGVKLSTTKIHFYNNEGWENVSAYLYGDLGEAFGGWPGTPAVDEGNGWWSAEIPGPASSNLFIIFNDNNNGHQSADYAINDQSKTYTIGLNGNVYATKEEAEKALTNSQGETEVYFYNADDWSKVFAYVYGDSTAFGSWPGKEAVDAGEGWWKITIPVAASSNLHLIFNDGNNGAQSADFIVDDSSKVYATSKNGSLYSSKEDAIKAMSGESGNIGGDTGNTGDDTGNTGSDTGNTGGDTGNTGGDTGNTGDNTGNTGGDTGNTGDNTGNTGEDTGNTGEDTGNTDGDTENTEQKPENTEESSEDKGGDLENSEEKEGSEEEEDSEEKETTEEKEDSEEKETTEEKEDSKEKEDSEEKEDSKEKENSEKKESSDKDEVDVEKTVSVETADGVPTMVISSLSDLLKAVFSDEEIEEIKSGKNMRAEVRVNKIDKPSQKDKEAVEGVLKNKVIGAYFDIDVLKIIGSKEKKVTELSKSVRFTLDIPKELQADNRAFSMIRVHGGKASVLEDLDSEKNTITFETDAFSTYVLVYASANDKTESKDSADDSVANEVQESVQVASPQTGDNPAVFVWAILLFAVGIAIVIGVRKNYLKKENEEV